MRNSLLVLVVLAAACGPKNTTSDVKDQFSGVNFLYFNAADRQQMMTDVRDMTIDNYALLSIKANRQIVVDPKKMFNEAIAVEAAGKDLDDSDAVGQARSNLQFLDRIKMTIANFQDTHFGASAVLSAPNLYNGLKLARVGADVVVVGKQVPILAYDETLASDPGSYGSIQMGVKVVSIDGVAVNDAVNALMPYVNASTRASADEWSVEYLSQRNFAYPDKNYADWVFEVFGRQTTIRLPYYYEATKRQDALAYLKGKGFKALDDLKLVYNKDFHYWTRSLSLSADGYNPYRAPKGLIGGTTWYSGSSGEEGYEVFRTGYMLKNGKSYGVLQVFDFSPSDVTLETSTPLKAKKSYASVIGDFITELGDSGTPLILDLRENGGGDPMNAVALMQLIGKAGETYPSTTRALRVTRFLRQMLEAGDLDKFPATSGFNYDVTALAELRKAIASHREYTTAFTLTNDIPSKGYYDQKIVALISPMCISACDGMGLLLKMSKRATLIGTTTNGTGAGFIGDGPYDNVKWRDRNHFVDLRIPNRLFGLGGKVGDYVMTDTHSFESLNSENRPAEADVSYVPTLNDYTNQGQGWFSKAIEVLNAK